MQNIREIANRRRLLTSTVAAFAAVGAAALTAVSMPADAATADDFRTPVFLAPTSVKSISFAAKGFSRWKAGSETGAVGSKQEPANLAVCYTYRGDHTGQVWALDMYSFVSQAPGSQDPTFTLPDAQGSNPTFFGGSPLAINMFESADCTTFLVKEFRGLTVPTSGTTFDLNLN